MPWYQRLALDVTARTLPALKLTGNGIPIAPSDNKSMLRMMSRDPLVIKATRVDALWGVTNLMDQAATWPDIRHNPEQPPLLILYGERDSIIPPRAFCRFIARVPLDGRTRLGLYADGWHMLPRDLQGAAVRQDILSWLQDPNAPLPSGEEIGPDRARLQRFCQAASPSLAAPRCPIEGEPDHVPDDIPAASRPCSRVASRYDRWPGRGRQGLANGRAGA
jgi:hypothetical protein